MQRISDDAFERRLMLAADVAKTPFEIGAVATVEGLFRNREFISDKRYLIIADIASREDSYLQKKKALAKELEAEEEVPKKKKKRLVVDEEEDD